MKINKNLETMLNFKGYGNPNGKFWFIGMEEALEVNEPDKLKPYEMGLMHYSIGDYSKEKAKFQLENPIGRYTQVYSYIGKLLKSIAKSKVELDEFLDENFIQKSGNNFYTILRPLGKSMFKLDADPAYLQFYGLKNMKEYLLQVENSRFKLIGDLVTEHDPSIVICFGKSLWSEYRKVFQLSEPTATFDKVEYYNAYNRSYYLLPFFGNGQMSDERIQSVADHIRNH